MSVRRGSRFLSDHPSRHHGRLAVSTIVRPALSPLARGMTLRRSKGNWSDESKMLVVVLRQRSLRRARHSRRGLPMTAPTSAPGISRFDTAVHSVSISASSALIALPKPCGDTAWSMPVLIGLRLHSSTAMNSSTTEWIVVSNYSSTGWRSLLVSHHSCGCNAG